MAPRTNVYIDGFNLYNGVVRGTPHKWLDLPLLFRRLRPDESIQQVFYFTAMVTGETQANQIAYWNALKTDPCVRIVEGKFKSKDVLCQVEGCCHTVAKRKFKVSIEKRTDVQIAIQMIEDAITDACDTLVLVSGDSDLVPVVQRIRRLTPQKRVFVYVPSRDTDRGAARELRKAATKDRDLPLGLVESCQYPDRVTDGKGGFVEKPAAWCTKADEHESGSA